MEWVAGAASFFACPLADRASPAPVTATTAASVNRLLLFILLVSILSSPRGSKVAKKLLRLRVSGQVSPRKSRRWSRARRTAQDRQGGDNFVGSFDLSEAFLTSYAAVAPV